MLHRFSARIALILPFALPACGGSNTTPQDGSTAGTDSGPLPPRADTGPAPDLGPAPPGSPPRVGPCQLFPADNPWNTDVSGAPLHPQSDRFIAQMSPTRGMHADWGNWSTDHYGIPWQTGTGAQPIAFMWTQRYGNDESDPRPCTGGGGNFCYPIPTDARIEGGPGAAAGADRHILYVDTAGAPNNCTLYEIYNAQNFTAAPWRAINGAIFPLGTNTLRTEGWTSADAAGLPILPGLVRYDEFAAGEIRHAIRFTMDRTARGYIHPATHAAGTTGTDLPPLGLRVRLKASFNVASLPAAAQVVARAMQRYGLLLADNGSDWFITGDSDDRWDAVIDDINRGLRNVHGSDFEVVDTGPIIPQGG